MTKKQRQRQAERNCASFCLSPSPVLLLNVTVQVQCKNGCITKLKAKLPTVTPLGVPANPLFAKELGADSANLKIFSLIQDCYKGSILNE